MSLISGKSSWFRGPFPDSGNCLTHSVLSSDIGPCVTFVLTKGKQQAKDKDGFQEHVLHRSEGKKRQTAAMFALKAHQAPTPSPDAFEGLLGLGPSGAGWA